MMSKLVTAARVVSAVLVIGWPAATMAAPTAQQRCQASKNKAAGKYVACRATAEAKFASKGDMIKYDESLTKCESKYQKAWGKAETKAVDAGSLCTTVGDQNDVQSVADEYSDNVAQHLGGAPLEDCPADLSTCDTDLTSCNGGTATMGDVLSGKTFSSSVGLGVTGTMADNGAVILTPSTTDQPIAAGYHDGSGKCVGDTDLVSGNIKSGVSLFGVNGDSNVVDTSSGTAAAGHLLAGKSAWVAGAEVNGAMPNDGAVTLAPGTADQAIAAGYHNGSGKCSGDANLVSGNIKSGVSVFGVNGSVIPQSGNAVAADVLSGKTFSNAGGAGTGSMPNNGAVMLTPSTIDQTIGSGYHNGAGQCAGDADLVAGNIRSGVNLFAVNGSSTVVDTSAATAAAPDIVSGKTAYAGGSLVTGSAPAGSDVSGANGLKTFTIPDGVYSGSKTATANDANLLASNIVNGVNIFGVTGIAGAVPSQVLKTGQITAYGTGSDGALQKGDARSFTDNGDGTITDNKTGLMWEKKSLDGSIHDYNVHYAFGPSSFVPPYAMDGPIVTTFLATLNAGGGFAGHTDWRIPNRFELESLYSFEYSPGWGSLDPGFRTACSVGCTVLTCSCGSTAEYWSSTTYAGDQRYAWTLNFANGSVNRYSKPTNTYSVRAVRGGV